MFLQHRLQRLKFPGYSVDRLNIQMFHLLRKSDTIVDLLDGAFLLYKRNFRSYLRLFIAICAFFSLIMFAILTGEINTGRSPITSFMWIILGETPPGSTQPLAAILRDISFFDGSIPWIIVASSVAMHISYDDFQKSLQHPSAMYANVALLSMIVGLLVILFRMMGFNLLSDIIRFPVLIAPYVIVVEHKNIITALKRSFIFVSKNFARTLLVFVISLATIRIVMASVFSGSILIGQIIYQGDIGNTFLRAAIPLFTILASVTAYMVLHIFTALFYYDLRIRYEGLDLGQRGIYQVQDSRN